MPEGQFFHQIFLSAQSEEVLPRSLQVVSDQSKALFVGFDHILWREAALREFLTSRFGGEVIAAYDKLKPLAYRADLARYCLIYCFGGWYADISLKVCKVPALSDSIEMVYFHDFGLGPPGPSSFMAACQNGFFYAKAKHPVMGRCIEMVLENCKNNFYGLNSTCPTGPMVFGKALLNYAPHPGLIPGYFMQLTPGHRQKNLAYILPEGDIAAFHKSTWHDASPKGGDLSAFGLAGSNNYNRMWENNDIYQ